MQKHSVTVLPTGYAEYFHVNLQKDKKTALAVNLTGTVLLVALLMLGHFAFVPFWHFTDDSDGFGMMLLRLAVMIAGYAAYIVLHELTHAAVMKLFGASKLRFGFTGLYAYAGSEVDYFTKGAYIAVALAPLIVWGIIFTVMLILVPVRWFWIVYFWQVGNITGAMGDLYVTVKFFKMPKDILVRDTGIEMTVYSAAEKPTEQDR